jgi:CheY-like chemotaxis protein
VGEGRLRFSLHTEIDADPADGSRPGALLHFTLIDERREEDGCSQSSQLLRHAGQLATLLGGSLEINDSDIDSDHFACGSIPLALAAASECRALEAARPRILVVDEDPVLREKAALQISRMGGEPLRAADGITAQVLLENIQFAAILLDPKTSGAGSLALLRMLRNREITQMRPRTAVFILGPAGSDSSRHDALKAGADGFLNQPLSFDALSLALDSVLTTRLPQTARVIQQN